MHHILVELRKELTLNADAAVKTQGEKYFKEPVKMYGMKSTTVTEIGKRYYRDLGKISKSELFGLCESLWQSGMMEESFIACTWAYNMRKEFEPEDFQVFERWVDRYVGNWASCDTLCNHTIGSFIDRYPGFITGLKRWALSPNRWMRRASAVSLIVPGRHGKFLPDILEIATILLLDRDDMVQKGYGWMLKVASKEHLDEIFRFVTEHKAEMPRTALRYAIEKMPAEMKAQAMKKSDN